jgi:hypothetical protein
MDKINAVTLCHIGTEFVVIAGVSFWLNRRITGLEEKIEIQNDIIGKQEEIIGQQGQMLMRHEQIIRQITGVPPLPGSQTGSGNKPPYTSGPSSGHGNKQPSTSGPGDRRPPPSQTHVNTTPVGVETQYQVEESDISDTELDKLIGNDELSVLQGSRKSKKDVVEDHIELICDEDDCDLKNQEIEIKIKKRRRGKGKRAVRQ